MSLLFKTFKIPNSIAWHIVHLLQGPQWQQYSTTWPPWQKNNHILSIRNKDTRLRHQYVIDKKYKYKNRTGEAVLERCPQTSWFSKDTVLFQHQLGFGCILIFKMSSLVFFLMEQKLTRTQTHKQPTSISALLLVAKRRRLVTEMRSILIFGVAY